MNGLFYIPERPEACVAAAAAAAAAVQVWFL